ncbi:MORN repeat protein [Ichthyophthirius multifiliis]|uniref:MORN repeat protein n=1 Tax=Ichthyophthirius multifiliis TaxID=5932 RepID=G0QUQ9_ICHMU|nr:MORN repeat protein [Ichthyophthirius multifiliis]EGR31044.1 MORN repeat protein [Ichthyophthirius multifiliis]|eukprot:XP_004034530.1 MORN repeat protein [Ichthyophthirius multifiliis]
MGNQCCSQSEAQNQQPQTNIPNNFTEEQAEQNLQANQHQVEVQVHANQQDENEVLEGIENTIQVDEKKFKIELQSLREALQKADAFKEIFYNSQNLTRTIYELEQILNYFSKTIVIPLHILNVKSDLLGLYGDLQNFRSFHSRFTLEKSFYEHLPAITQLLNFIKNFISSNSKYIEKGVINYQQLVFDLNTDQNFDESYNKIKLLRSAQNEVSGTNFSTLPNYLYVALKDKKGFELWETILPYQFEVSNKDFVEVYINETYSFDVKDKILALLYSMDLNNDQRIDIYQFLSFVESFDNYFDNDGRIIIEKLDELQSLIHVQRFPPKQNVSKQNCYVYQSGMEYEGIMNDKGERTGHGVLKDEEYEFQGEFLNDLPHGKGIEIRKKVKYEGDFLNGLYHGQGTLSFPNGRSYTGNFINHQFHGQGELIGDDGIRYKGEWKNGQLEDGVITYHDNSYYIGKIKKNFFKEGKGIFYSGEYSYTIFEGEWYQDKPFQCKQFSLDDGVTMIYQGQFNNYYIEGKGSRFYADGSVYEGEMLRDKKQGEGTCTYKDESMFTGIWENDFQVDGTYYYNKKNLNNYYKGTWQNGIQNGKGKHQYPSGGIYEGEIQNNKRHGYGVYKYSNGNVYDGQWVENNQQGDGKFIFSSEGDGSGDVYYGQFDKGKFQGFGHYIYKKSNKQYIGFWKNDMWEGHGKFINGDGNIIKCGIWKNDKLETAGNEKDLDFPQNWQQYKINLDDLNRVQPNSQQNNV